MRKSSTQFVCSQCGYESVQWYGKCPNCGEWNTFQEFKVQSAKLKVGERRGERQELSKPIKLADIKALVSKRIASGIGELDRVLGGGFVIGSVVLLAGEPGVGKSTLLLEIVKRFGDVGEVRDVEGTNIIYVCGEESPEQVKMRAERLGVVGQRLSLLPETNVERVIEEVGDVSKGDEITFVIVDSVQTLWSEEIEGSPGSISQVKGCSQKLLEFSKKNGITMVLVGHVNKDGNIAGPMTLSHMVDGVFFLEGERFADLRLLRGIKNRFGPTDEVGVFKMGEKGMEEVKNPSELFLSPAFAEATAGEAGKITVCAMEGTRPMLLEIQALVTQSALEIPRRVVSGIDANRVLLLAAVLQKTLGLPLYNQDIFVKVSGGFKIGEPAADLGICLAIISSFKNLPVASKTCVFGEVGLLGEVRRVSGEEKREKEARKLGFTNIISSRTIKSLRETTRVLRV